MSNKIQISKKIKVIFLEYLKMLKIIKIICRPIRINKIKPIMILKISVKKLLMKIMILNIKIAVAINIAHSPK